MMSESSSLLSSGTTCQTLRPRRVLLVDDDTDVVRLLQHMLQRGGYEVRTAENGDEALAIVAEDCPDYLITDWLMPGMNGIDLCRHVRQLPLPHYVYVVFITGKSSTSDLVEGLAAGADDFLTKPVKQGELFARLQTGQRVLLLERQLRDAMRTDPLTGVSTRRVFDEEAQREFARLTRYNTPLTCAMIDVDFFKRINDTYGHPAGDEVLRQVGRLLRRSTRACDLLCRYGGEEFCLLLPHTTEDAAAQWAERVRQQIAELPIVVQREVLHVTASFGLAEAYADTASVAALVDLADQALLVAKNSGRNRVVAYRSLAADVNPLREASNNPFHDVTARDVMSSIVSTLRQDETVGQAADYFLRLRFNAAPVVDEHGRLVGMLSEKNLLAHLNLPDVWEKPIAQIMSTNVVCYDEATPASVIHDFLCRVTIRRVVIVKDGYPTGMVDRGTLLRWYRNWLTAQQRAAGREPNRSEVLQAARGSLVRTAATIEQQAAALQRNLAEASGDLVPALIHGASRIQELINDMLSESRELAGCAW
jgi:two-component system cell cycle response regulator